MVVYLILQACLQWLVSNNISSTDDIVGILCETDVGLRTAEYFASTLQIESSNGINEARRDKYMMMETMRRNGLNSIQQILTDSWTEVNEFINNTLKGRYPVVIKPSRGSGSKNVYKCSNASYAKSIFTRLLGTPGYANNTITDAILVQEYIEGTEYVVDISSSNGEHKVVGIWRHDKRDVGDISFVYYCSEIVSNTNTVICQKLCEYAVSVVDALDVMYGPSHLEIKIDEKTQNAVLIEANVGRLHGLDIIGLSNLAYGYNFAETTVHGYVDKYRPNCEKARLHKPHQLLATAHTHHHKSSRWENFPDRVPSHVRMHARLVHLVNNHKTGKLHREKQEIKEQIERLESLLGNDLT